MCRTRDITWCWVFLQAKGKKHSSSWHCRVDSFKNQTCIEDHGRDTRDTGEGERGGGRLTALLKWEILAVLKSLGTLPRTVREPGFTPTRWSTGLLEQDEVSRSPPQSSCKSRPEGTSVGSYRQNPARSPGNWPAFLYRKTSFTFLPKSKDCYSSKHSFSFFSENTRY